MVKQRSPKPLMWVRFLLSLQVLYYGDCGEVVNASVCGTDTRGFDSHQSPFLYIIIGVQPSGKATDFDSVMRWFESSYPSFFILILMAVQPSGKARVCKTLTVGSNPTTAFCFIKLPMWRNWQTRWTQNPVPSRACRFDPDHRYLFYSNVQSTSLKYE